MTGVDLGRLGVWGHLDSYPIEEGRSYAQSLGADEYFTKPFSPTALLNTVERVLSASP